MSNDLVPVEPPPPVRRWVWEDFAVLSVYEKEETLRVEVKRDPETKVVVSSEAVIHSLGWFVRVSGSSALYVGKEKPALAPGDKVRFTMEKVV